MSRVGHRPLGRFDRREGSVELRDGDARRYGGKGVLKAVENVSSQHRAGACGRTTFATSAASTRR